MQKTIEKIHRKFDTAGEKLLAQAKAIVSAPMVSDTTKIERFQKIGFTAGKPIKDSEEMFKKQEAAKETIECIEYFQTYYPSYKFISEEQIEKICKKYGLLYGDAKQYIGDIPEKNLSEIEAFKLREEDYFEDTEFAGWVTFRIPRVFYSPITGTLEMVMSDTPPSDSAKKSKPAFKICAPKKDFNTQGHEIKKGYKLVYDPIVIQPVKYKNCKGGLVVSKWGIEGQDESLINEKQN